MKYLKINSKDDLVTIQSEYLSAKFRTGKNFALLEFRHPEGAQIFAPAPEGCEFWKLRLIGPDGTSPEITNKQAEFKGAVVLKSNPRETILQFKWAILLAPKKEAGVFVEGRFSRTEIRTFWRIRVELLEGWSVQRADFPIIPNIQPDERLKLAAPFGWGVEYPVKAGLRYEGTYPSCIVAMQFVALYQEGHGLYIAAHDAQANHKDFSVISEKPASACLKISHTPPLPVKTGGIFELPYDIVLGGYEGAYFEAAQIYKEFSYITPWGKAGRLSRRRIPDWLKETDLWLRPDGSAADNLKATKKAMDFFAVPTALHWYRWHEIPYDTNYPDYFPAKAGFAEGIKELQKKGAHIVPYINGRLWDPAAVSWKKEGAANAAARSNEGLCYTEIYGSRVPNNVMCPYTELWQQKMAQVVRKMLLSFNVDGVYIDQICAAKAELCYNPAHGHPIGGGCFWHEGYRKLLKNIRENLPPEVILTTEENAECWIDLFDALLLVNTPMDQEIIPLFLAVYSGRVINYGFLYYSADEPSNALSFRFKLAQNFIYGSQLGWIRPTNIMAKGAEREAAFLKKLIQARREARDFILSGEFLGLPEVGGDNPPVIVDGNCAFGGTYSKKPPSVIASAWRSERGELGMLVVNHTPHVRNVEITPPASSGAAGQKIPLTMPTLSAKFIRCK